MCHTMPTNQQSTSIWMIITYRKAQDGFKPNRPGAPPCQNWINKTRGLPPYSRRLQQHLEFPCQLTGIEDFDWEEYYVIGPGSKAEHERLRKTRPSCMDTYDLLSFDDDVDPDSGLLVHVRRVSDKKTFLLPLADLEATKKKTKNYQLLDDYAVWFVNWR